MRRWCGLVLITLITLSFGCGDGTICFGGNCSGNDDDDERNVSMSGNVSSILPPNASRDTDVFVYTALEDLADGPPFDEFKDARATTLDSEGTFELSRLRRGRLTVIFNRDHEEVPNGTIDDGDECSVLLDGGDLSDVLGNQAVTLEDVDVDFSTEEDSSTNLCSSQRPTNACGCARADEIRVRTTPPEE